MTRRMQPAPEGVMVAKTSRGRWIALEEIWDKNDPERLLDVRPLRLEGDPETICQTRERREIVTAVENAILRARLKEAETRLRELRGAAPERYATAS